MKQYIKILNKKKIKIYKKYKRNNFIIEINKI